MASRETIKLTANPSRKQAGTILDVNERLHVLAQQLKNRKPEDVAEALKLVNQYSEMVIEPERDLEYFKRFEMDLLIREWANPTMLTDLGNGFAFHEDNADTYDFKCVMKNGDKLEHRYEMFGVDEVVKIVNVNNLPAVERKMIGNSAVFYAGEMVGRDQNYEITRSPINIDGKLAYVALTTLNKWLIVVNSEEQPVPEEFDTVESIKYLNGKILIEGFGQTIGEKIFYYDNKKVETDVGLVDVGDFFIFKGQLGYTGRISGFSDRVIAIGNKRLKLKGLFPDKEIGDVSFDDITEILDKLAITVRNTSGHKYIVYDGKVTAGWEFMNKQKPETFKYLTHPVQLDDSVVFAAQVEDNLTVFLINQNNQHITLDDFDAVYQVVPLQGKICAILGKKGDKFIRRVYDLSEGWSKLRSEEEN